MRLHENRTHEELGQNIYFGWRLVCRQMTRQCSCGDSKSLCRNGDTCCVLVEGVEMLRTDVVRSGHNPRVRQSVCDTEAAASRAPLYSDGKEE
jgi:hypothetical protein